MSGALEVWTQAMAQIRSRRKDLGLTQRQLGDAAGYNENTVFRWETGKEAPSFAAITNMMVVLGGKLAFEWDAPPKKPVRSLTMGRPPRTTTQPEVRA